MKILENKIPEGWQKGSLGDFIIDIKDGGTPSRCKAEYFGGNIPWVIVKDIKPLIKNTKESLSELGLKNSSAKLFPAGSIILSFGATIGEVGITAIPVATKQGVAGILLDENKIETKYLYFLLQSFKKYLNQIATGSTIKEVRPTVIKKISVLMPPITEQKKIANILSSVDEEIKKADEIILQTEKIKNGLMQDLFARGIGHKKFKKTKIGEIPEEWENLKLNDVFKLTSGKGLSKKNFVKGKFPVYGGNGISGTHSDYFLEDSNIIIGRVGEYCGAVHLTAPKSWVTDNALYISRFKREVVQLFLFYLLSWLNLNQYAKIGGQPSISQDTVGFIDVGFPRLEEQKKIAETLSTIDEEMSANKNFKVKLTQLKKGLMQDLLSGKVRVK